MMVKFTFKKDTMEDKQALTNNYEYCELIHKTGKLINTAGIVFRL